MNCAEIYIEWLPFKAVAGVDRDREIIKTEFDEYKFDDAAIYATYAIPH